jgi:hypothetical protein
MAIIIRKACKKVTERAPLSYVREKIVEYM